MAQKLIFRIGASCIPKDNPERPLGEDAYFFDEMAQVIGIADGVGGSAKRGIDSGKYARQLMRNAANAVTGCHSAEVNPKEVLEKAHRATVEEGSSTACIICIHGHLLRAANLGDSGFLVVRNGESVFKSRARQHIFNCPYQISSVLGGDTPDDAEMVVVALEEGDVIVAGTDGLWDNVFMEDIKDLVKLCLGSGDTPESMASWIAIAARVQSLKQGIVSPFQSAAMKAGLRFSGGKPDDITVVVAYVENRGPVN